MDNELIAKKLKKNKLDKYFYYLNKIDSTNNFAFNLAQKGSPEWTIVLTNEQTDGKGRLNRTWEGGENSSLLFSIILKPTIPVFHIQLISLFIGIIAVEFFEKYIKNHNEKIKSKMKFRVKWPNDVFLNGKKMGGILLKSSIQNKLFSYIVCGIGLNINQTTAEFSNEIKEKATSLKIETGIEWNREEIFTEFISYIKENYDNMNRDFKGITERWKRKAMYLGKQIKIHQFDELKRGKFIGINSQGHLIMENFNGQEEIITGDLLGRKEKL
ncbi:MAG: biotin--[acetyl-CoA-carboxylase] ligase [Calditrichia bacterium]|nr:biotin--[acetyl-CoA-carboxylase] ligase [Calditrichia bacterium]